jgi:hypothetical protein
MDPALCLDEAIDALRGLMTRADADIDAGDASVGSADAVIRLRALLAEMRARLANIEADVTAGRLTPAKAVALVEDMLAAFGAMMVGPPPRRSLQ